MLQVLPTLDAGGVERGTLEVARRLVEIGHRSLVMSAGGRMVEQLEQEGSTHITWPIGHKTPWTLRLIWKFRRFLIEQKVDILHVRSRMPGWVAWLAWKGMDPASRPHFVTTVHGLYSVSRYSSVMMKGERIIAVSEAVRRYILDNYPEIDATCIQVIPRGIDPAVFSNGYQPSNEWLERWRADYPALSGKCVLTLPGRLTRLKGHEDLIELVRRLKARGLLVHGLIVGGEDPKRLRYAAELRTKVAEAGLLQDITFTGHRSDLREIMAVSDIVLSLSAKPESFGRTTLEALSLGVPVIGYDHGGVSEILDRMFVSGKVPAMNPDALEQAILRVMTEHIRPEKLDCFSLSQMLESTIALYQAMGVNPNTRKQKHG